jgi:hypothetical protein
MALTDEGGGNMVLPVTPLGNNNNNFGGDFGGWLVLFLIFGMFNGGWGGFGGGYGNGQLSFDFPWLLNGQNNTDALVSNGFQNAQLTSQLTGLQSAVTSGFGDVQTALCGGFAGVNASINGAQNAISQQLYSNQIADLERSYAAQTAQTAGMNQIAMNLQGCCCENRSNIADLKYTVATENCADRAAISDGIRDVLTATQAQTNAILNQLCADKLEQKNDVIAQLRSELMYARGQASQDVQTAAIQAGQRALANEVEQYVAPMPRPAYIVQNPNCCGNNYGCGCGM